MMSRHNAFRYQVLMSSFPRIPGTLESKMIDWAISRTTWTRLVMFAAGGPPESPRLVGVA
jgi:hypothetical protein